MTLRGKILATYEVENNSYCLSEVILLGILFYMYV